MIETPILIVGAGPSGLMLSAQLHRYGAPHVVVDRKQGITRLSKALGVQARTLEQYRQLGIADQAIAQGFVAKTVRFVVNGRLRATIPLGEIGTGLSPYPYLFVLEQSRNEALLLDHIVANGADIRWGHDVTQIGDDGSGGYVGTMKRADGSTQSFQCRYLIGCGGARSPVRHYLDMPFRGGTNEQLFFVADIQLDLDLEKQGLLLVIHRNEFLAFFPMSGRNRYRAIGVLPSAITDPDNIPFPALKKHIEDNIGLPARITTHSWHAGYRVHHRIVDTFRKGNAFLVGDAAHIHSPAGGQGMNTGLGDAVNLGWKLAAVVNGWSPPRILESYNAERRPFGVQLVHTTDKAFAVIASRHWLPRLTRTHILPLVLRTVLSFGSLRTLMFKTISQTRIAYPDSPLSDGSRSRGIRSGDRFPWFEWNEGNSFDWLSQPGYVVLALGEGLAPPIPDWSGPVTQFAIAGDAAKAAVEAGLPARGSVVVRPDMHIASIHPQ